MEASQLSVKFGAKHFRVLEIQKKMATLQEQIKGGQSMLDDRLRADYERSVRDEANLRNELEVAKGEAVQQNQASIQYSVLQQDLETAKALYTDFLNKTSQADIQRAEQFNNVRLIESAETPAADRAEPQPNDPARFRHQPRPGRRPGLPYGEHEHHRKEC